MRAPLASLLLAAPLLLAAAPVLDDDDLERMRDYGATLSVTDAARAAGDYQLAEDAMRGYLARWRDRGISVSEVDAIERQVIRFIELRSLLEQAASSNAAAARYLSAVVTHAEPSARAQEQARALALLSRHNPGVRALFLRCFPAELVVTVDPPPDMPANPIAVQFRNSLIDITRAQELRLWGTQGKGTLSVHVTMRENDRRNSLLEGTAMKSWALHISIDLVDDQGALVTSTATTTALLGINPGNASMWGQSKAADRIYTALLDELARQVDRGDLPTP